MQNVKDYWVGKNDRAKVAIRHTTEMANKYSAEIAASTKATTEYNEFHVFPVHENAFDTVIVVEDTDSVSAVMK